MERERSLERSFNKEADRREYEISQSSEEGRDQIKTLREEAEQEKKIIKMMQELRREKEMKDARQKILRDQQQRAYTPSTMPHKRYDRETVEKLAARQVEVAHTAELASVDRRVERRIDEVLAIERKNNLRLQEERDSVEAMRIQKHKDTEATRLSDRARSKIDDDGRTDGRER